MSVCPSLDFVHQASFFRLINRSRAHQWGVRQGKAELRIINFKTKPINAVLFETMASCDVQDVSAKRVLPSSILSVETLGCKVLKVIF